jgi:predicted component of type VI protein secretion system
MGKLVLYLPDGTVHDIVLDKERLTIGRRPDNDICLPYPAVSGEHAAVVTILADSFLEDLGSTNGTLVNGKPVVKHFLRDNDLIDIGRQRLVYFSDVETRADPLPPDILRRELAGLHDQVERVRGARERSGEPKKPTRDPLIPDEELLSDLPSAALPGPDAAPAPQRPMIYPERAVDSEGTPAARVEPPLQAPEPDRRVATPATSTPRSTVASRLASTWEDGAEQVVESAATPRRESPAPRRAAAEDRAPSDPVPEIGPVYRVRVLNGASAGREMTLSRDAFSVGRVGLQVARIAQQQGVWRLEQIEGGTPVTLNGTPLPEGGMPIRAGDRFRVAGVVLAFEQR